MTVFDMAQKYYPRLWDDARLQALVAAGRLTQSEYRLIIGKDVKNDAS